MYRGTTPNQVFKLYFLMESEEELYITYVQNGTVILEKQLSDITESIDEVTGFSVLSFRLTQTETLLFSDEDVDIQIRIKFTDGTAIASDLIRTHVDAILKEGEI